MTLASSARQYLYVSNGFVSTVPIYLVGRSKPALTLQGAGGSVMAFGPTGVFYVSNGVGDGGEVDAYRGSTRILQIGELFAPYGVAVDNSSYLYISNATTRIDVYAPFSTTIAHSITRGVHGAQKLAFGPNGDLYACNYTGNSVSVYTPTNRPGYPKFARALTGLYHANGVAFDGSGNVYASTPSSVHEYDPSSFGNIRTITGLRYVVAVAVDPGGMVYAASAPPYHFGHPLAPGYVTVFAPGQTKPLRKITDGVDSPTSLAVDAVGNLYVGNLVTNAVTVYSGGGASKIQTITNGIHSPEALGFSSST